jgi:hypothetical protein
MVLFEANVSRPVFDVLMAMLAKTSEPPAA